MERLPFPNTPDEHTDAENLVRVVVERGIDSPGAAEGLTYAGTGLAVGDHVEVPLGRTTARGIVVQTGGRELLEGLSPARLKPVIRRTGAALPPNLINLATWLARYYVCPLGMVLATMLPASVKAGVGRRTQRLVEPANPPPEPPPPLTPAAARALDRIDSLPKSTFPLDPGALARLVGAANRAPINRLLEAGLLRTVERPVIRAPDAFDAAALDAPTDTAHTLTPEQHAAFRGIAATLGAFQPHLLRGITGSGKTEVYLSLIEQVLSAGSTAIVLVPEIALTPQTAGRFVARFRDQGVAVLHSGLTASTRHKQWAAAASGEARVVVGARSAIFAPVPDLGLIVVDEEHDSSYKQDQLPRYNARDVAIKRAQLESCPVVLGSATPSLESWHNAAANPPRYTLWTLTSRVGGARLPAVEIVDMAAERRARRAAAAQGHHLDPVGPRLERAIAETLDAGAQAILLLNRRGYAGYIACPDARCAWRMECRDCDATLVLHRPRAAADRPEYLRCHHCLAEQLTVTHCPVCNKRTIHLGMGTQRAEEFLEARFGPSHGLRLGETLLRLDSDTMRSAADYFNALDRFGRGQVRVLLGTQMIAKGLDFPGVRLVGVINADTALNLPDFRAAERTFQLVSQVAGRAGRGVDPGRVLVQTFVPDEPAIVHASRHDYTTFAAAELRARRHSNLPPHTRLARVIVRDEDHDRALALARSIASTLRDAAAGRATIEGPAPCPVARIAGRYRIAVDVSAPTASAIQLTLGAARTQGLLKSDHTTAVDVDPVALL